MHKTTGSQSDFVRSTRLLRDKTSRSKGGFSLVEISLAIAIVAFSFVAMLGMIPSGLGNLRAAMNTQTAAEISQRVIGELQETDFDALLAAGVEQGGAGVQFYRLPLRYFDEQGQEVRVGNSDVPTTEEKARIVYTLRVRGSLPGKANPTTHSSAYFTSLPSATAQRFNPRDSTFLAVQVAVTEGRAIGSLIDGGSFLFDVKKAADSGVQVKTYSALVTRNGYLAKR